MAPAREGAEEKLSPRLSHLDIPLVGFGRSRVRPVYLLLGHPDDAWCRRVRGVLEARGNQTHMIANPFVHPARFSWRLTSAESISELADDDGFSIRGDQIAGVFVLNAGWVEPAGWELADLAYMQAESQAALLAWLWSLSCPMVNRYPSALWYRSQAPLLAWQPLLRRCGVPVLETLITNVEAEARDFDGRRTGAESKGIVYAPLTSDARYLVSSEQEWRGLSSMQSCAPTCLTYPHGSASIACVVGRRVIWEGEPASGATLVEPALHRFMAKTGLSLAEFAFASTDAGLSAVAVETRPNLGHFHDATQQVILEGIVDLLTLRERVAVPA
jgi:hypothetical protein